MAPFAIWMYPAIIIIITVSAFKGLTGTKEKSISASKGMANFVILCVMGSPFVLWLMWN